jgi:hypothetical protein
VTIRGISLSELPTLTSVEVVDLKATDVLVFTMPGRATPAQLQAVQDLVAFAWPGRKAIVLDNGAMLKVVESV